MTTTTKAGALASLPISYEGQPEEERTKIQELQRIQQELRGALQNRQQLFDPVLLAMAQGFLAPTKTGSFGESIANAAALVGPAQASAEKQRLERLAMEKELAAIDLGQIAEGQKRRLGAGLLKPGQPMSPEELQRYAQLVGPEQAAKMAEIRTKMDETQRQELFRTIIPDLLTATKGQEPTLQDMLAIAKVKGVDPRLVLEFYKSLQPETKVIGEGQSAVKLPMLGGGLTPTAGAAPTAPQAPVAPQAAAQIAPQGATPQQGMPAVPQVGAPPMTTPGGATTLYTAPRKPLEIERKVALLKDPASDPELKLALALELYKDGVDVKRVLTQGGEMTVSTLDLLNRQLPQIMKGPPPQATTPTATSARPAAPQTAPQAATRPAEAPPRAAPERTFGPGKFAIPGPGRIEEAPTGFSPGSKEDLEARVQQTRSDTERFNKVYESAAERGQAATRTIPVLETALRAVQSADFRGGILAKPEQLANQIKSSLGLADNVDVSRMLKTGVVDQALREQVLQNLRASFGGNPTEGERAFLMSVNSISDPRELLTYTLMGKMAAAQKDATKFDYLRTYSKYGTAADASFDRWSAGKGPEAYYPPLVQAREQLLNSAAIAEQWKSKGGYQPDKYDYELRDGVWHRRPKQR